MFRLSSLFALSSLAMVTSIPALAYNCSHLSSWESTAVYNSGDCVQHNSKAYQANWWTKGSNPEQFSSAYQEWTLLGSCNGTEPPPVENQSPQVSLISPLDGAAYIDGPLYYCEQMLQMKMTPSGGIKSVPSTHYSAFFQQLSQSPLERNVLKQSIAPALEGFHQTPGIFSRICTIALFELSILPEPIGRLAASPAAYSNCAGRFRRYR